MIPSFLQKPKNLHSIFLNLGQLFIHAMNFYLQINIYSVIFKLTRYSYTKMLFLLFNTYP